MTAKLKSLTLCALVGIIGIGSAGAVAGNKESNETMSCEIAVDRQANRVILQPTVFAGEETRGSFQFRVKGTGSSGRTNISQGSSFSTMAGEPLVVGRIMLSGNKSYKATLEVEASGESVECVEDIHSQL